MLELTCFTEVKRQKFKLNTLMSNNINLDNPG